MIRFKPYANSSATRTVFTMGREVGAWPCGCTVDCDYESMTLRTCNKDDCIRDAETPWTPPALRQPSTFRCTKCSWRGLLSETGGWVPAGGNCDEGEDVCPECRADIAIVPRDGQARFCTQCKLWGPANTFAKWGVCDACAVKFVSQQQAARLSEPDLIAKSFLARTDVPMPPTPEQRERRERIAVEMMKAHLIALLQANPDAMPSAFARDAVRSTDALLEALEEKP
jgi:hypothetical protein